MTRKTKGWLVMFLIIGGTMVLSAWNSTGISKFIDEKMPWLAKFKSKVSK